MSQIIVKSSISEVRIAIARSMPDLIEETARMAKDNIEHETEQHHSGRVYPSRREPGVEHTASAPGESFATDTASLISGIKINPISPLTTEILFQDQLGINRWAIFEFGGGRIAARPTIVPVIEHMQDKFVSDAASVVFRALTEQEVH